MTSTPTGAILTLLDLASRPLGLSAGIFFLYVLTFVFTFIGVDGLARRLWPEFPGWVGIVAFSMVLAAKAGNIGTNHLFEAILLDRLVASSLGWMALSLAIGGARRRAPWVAAALLGIASWVHPSLGLQLGMFLGVCWIAWSICSRGTGVTPASTFSGLIALGLALLPSILNMAGQGGQLFEGMPADEFLLWTAYVQSPQHMIPHLWRQQQWLAAGCYGVLSLLALMTWFRTWHEPKAVVSSEDPSLIDPKVGTNQARLRFGIAYAILLFGLLAATIGIEWVEDVRIILFQPFRMATLAQGLALLAISGRIVALWQRGDALGRVRAALLVIGLAGDWMLVIATLVECGSTLARRINRRMEPWALVLTLSWGLWFLSRHDTESGHVILAVSLGALAVGGLVNRRTNLAGRFADWNPARVGRALALSWTVPLAALVFPLLPASATTWGRPVSDWLLDRCRFTQTPREDLERLAVWCRNHTPPDARFVGPPGPKTFRLWSLRSLAFNRAGSPYHAAGLADWADRFRQHVDFNGNSAEFARAYLNDRQALERRYNALTSNELATLARRQGAGYVIANPDRIETRSGAMDLLRNEGEFAVFRVSERDPPQRAQRRREVRKY